jgi:hypothetical protein
MSMKPTSDPADRSNPGSPPESAIRCQQLRPPDAYGAYPRLSDAQVAALGSLDERRTQPGEVLFQEGERNCDFDVSPESRSCDLGTNSAGV